MRFPVISSKSIPILSVIGLAALVFGSGWSGRSAKYQGASMPELMIRLVSGGEYVARPSVTYNGTGLVYTTDHCLELIWRSTAGPETVPFSFETTSGSTGTTGTSGTTGTTGTTGSTGSTGSTGTTGTAMAIGKPAGLTAQIGSSGGGTSGTTGGGTGGCSSYAYTKTQVYTYAYVDSATGGPSVGFGGGPGTVSGFAGPAGSNPGSNLGSIITIQSANSAAQVCTLLTPGNNVYIEWHSPGTLVGGTFKFHILTFTETLGSNDNSTWTACNISTGDQPYLVTVTKQACQVASIDSRVAFSDADTIPTDANVSGRNLNFGSSIYKGGAFVGNMGPGNSQNDRSGTARLQMYPGLTTGLSNYAMVIASVLHAGDPSYADGDMAVGAYCPATTDPNLPGTSGAASISNVTWASQWLINPTPSWVFPPVYTTNPVSLTTLLGSADTTQAGQTATLGSKIGDYASFVLTAVYDQAYTPTGGGTAYSTMAVTPWTAGQAICIAAANEGTYRSNGTSLFHWLMSQNYPVTGLAYPYTDASPRLWLIQGTGIN